MFGHVLVGIDGAAGGRDALALATQLRSLRGQLTLVNVYPRQSYVWKGGTPAYRLRDRTEAAATVKAAADQAGVRAELWCIESPSPGAGLHQLAEDLKVDLLVVGSSRRGFFGRVMLGDDSRAALDGAPCAVAIAPAGYTDHRGAIASVGVGFNDSEESEHAVGVARALARELRARLAALEVVSLPAGLLVSARTPVAVVIDELLAEAREHVAVLGGVEAHAAFGRASEELALFSASVDLLVIGSRGYGPLGRAVHGSTAMALARSARCPLLVLTRGARAKSARTANLAEATTGR